MDDDASGHPKELGRLTPRPDPESSPITLELPPGHPRGQSRVLPRVDGGAIGTLAAYDTALGREIDGECVPTPAEDTATDHQKLPPSLRQIGQYRVTGRVGRGGMGAVYAGEHVLLGRLAAIKVLLPEFSQNKKMVTRFFNEARAASTIRHPGIVEIYDFGWNADGTAFIVMEHLEGETLGRRMARQPHGWKAALAIVRQIAGALSAAHGKGIVHRDLKPDNIFLVRDPEVPGGERIKLLDFGIAKLTGESATGMHLTRTGAVMGTPTYMSPEQCRGRPADHRADLYALGCIAFELCGGRPPFSGTGPGDVLASHIRTPPPSIAETGGDVPPELDQLVQQLLAKSPEDRIQSAADLIRAVDALNPGGARAAAAPTGLRPAVSDPAITKICSAASARTSVRMSTSAGRRSLAMRIAVAALLGGAMLAVAWMAMLGRGEQVAQRSAPLRSSPRAAPTPPGVERAPGRAAAMTDPPPSAGASPLPRKLNARPDPNVALATQMKVVLARFVDWSRNHPGAPCPRSSDLGPALRDPWGQPLETTCTDQPANQVIGVVSSGADGVRGTRDDIASWQLGRKVSDVVHGPRWSPTRAAKPVRAAKPAPTQPLSPQPPGPASASEPRDAAADDDIPSQR